MDGLRLVWYVSLDHERVQLKKLWQQLITLLPRVESENPQGLWAQIMDPSAHRYFPNGLSPDDNADLHSAGVGALRGARAAIENGGLVLVHGPSVGGAIGPTLVTEAVLSPLTKEDNLRKLGMGPSNGRAELFVWLDGTEAALALTTPLTAAVPIGEPVDGPKLPQGVTGVWAAAVPNDHRGALGIWYSNGGIWRIMTIDDPAFADRDLVEDQDNLRAGDVRD